MHRNRKQYNSFFIVNMASGVDRVCIGPMMAMVAILQLILSRVAWWFNRTYMILDIHVMVNWQLSKQGIRWPVSRDHITGPALELIKVTCFWKVDCWLLVFDWIAGSSQISLLIWAGLFGRYTSVFHCFWDYWNSKQKAKQYKQKTSLQIYKTQIKILAYPGLA